MRLIETDAFPFEFVSRIAERESWRKEIHRPIYHVHKWWAKRLGSVFRGMLLGCVLPEESDLEREFYQQHDLGEVSVLDPFMGSGTTIGEAHKLGMTALGRDINPVAYRAVKVALGPLDRPELQRVFRDLTISVGKRIQRLYAAADSRGQPGEVLYYFWVMQATCPKCEASVDLFPSWILARNVSPNERRKVQVVCPECGKIFPCAHDAQRASCPNCESSFDIHQGTTNGAKATCRSCKSPFRIVDTTTEMRPSYRLVGKLVLTANGNKEYIAADDSDEHAYAKCTRLLRAELKKGRILLPHLRLANGYNTKQAMRYGFERWQDFFNDRQLLALGWLHREIRAVAEPDTREALLTLFSGVLEFNNLFASYKGEGTGAVRHMFAHHILKPERLPIEANVWGTPRSSGAFSTLFKNRLLRAIEYKSAPSEVYGATGKGKVCSAPFVGKVQEWPYRSSLSSRGVYLSCDDSSKTGLTRKSIDLVVTDPPFFDNVHYSELADFFYAWQQLDKSERDGSTRKLGEVQDSDVDSFSKKLGGVFRECHRVLRDDGLMVFTYHHSRDDGWFALAHAILDAGFVVVNSQPVKGEMSVAAPKSQAKEPIQLDIIVVCRKVDSATCANATRIEAAVVSAREKIARLQSTNMRLSRNDAKVIIYGQLLTSIRSVDEIACLETVVASELDWFDRQPSPPARKKKAATLKPDRRQLVMFTGELAQE